MARFSRLFAALLLAAFMCFSAQAQAVELRGSDRDGYSRLVLDFGSQKPPAHNLSEPSATKLQLTLKATSGITVPQTAFKAASGIAVTAQGADTVITLTREKGAKHRVVKLGNRLMLDVFGTVAPQEAATQPVPEKKPEVTEAAKPAPKTEAVTEAETAAKAEASAAIDMLQETPTSAPKEDKPPQAEKAAQAGDPVLNIEIAATDMFGVASFIRGDDLYLVIDQPDFSIPPQISGSQKDILSSPQIIPADQATIFKFSLRGDIAALKGLTPKGVGGDMVWRLTWDAAKPAANVTPLHEIAGNVGYLEWNGADMRRIVSFVDPQRGEELIAVTVKDSKTFAGLSPRDFPELTRLPSPIGMGLVAKVDDLSVAFTDMKSNELRQKLRISRPDGLALASAAETRAMGGATVDATSILQMDKRQAELPEDTAQASSGKRGAPSTKALFHFNEWIMGGPEKLRDNHVALLHAASLRQDAARAQELIHLGKTYLANGLGAEANGLFNLASDTFPPLLKSPEFLALRGAAQALAGRPREAFRDLFSKSLDDIPEVKLWRTYTLAELEDWQQAATQFPLELGYLKDYPDRLKINLSLVLAEAALRDGRLADAGRLLNGIKDKRNEMIMPQQAALSYLEGETARQSKNYDGAITVWEPLTKGDDDLYRAKAGLSLVKLMQERQLIETPAALDKLEALRYAWRGDELETSIAVKLGELYIENEDYLKGLSNLQAAADYANNAEVKKSIQDRMKEVFSDLFTAGSLETMDPVQALTLYDEFGYLMPAGEAGDAAVQRLSERVTDAGMFERAASLLKSQAAKPNLSVENRVTAALNLAAIDVRDGRYQEALKTIDEAEKLIPSLGADKADPKQREAAIMRATALSRLGKAQEAFDALALTAQDEKALRLRTDIAWKAQLWAEAADALGQLVQKQGISATRPLTDEEADMILNWVVALNLSGDRFVLSNVREKYGPMMSASKRAKEFEVVTRPRQNVGLSDRKTIEGFIGEVEMFEDFLTPFNPGVPAEKESDASGAASPQLPSLSE